MSDHHNATTTPVETTTEPKPSVVYNLEKYEEGDMAGYGFYTPEYSTLDAIREAYGDAVVLGLCNTLISAKVRTKVKLDNSRIVKDKKNDKGMIIEKSQTLDVYREELKKKFPTGVLFTVDQVKNWKPGVREETANSIFQKAQKAFQLGTPEGFAEGKKLLDRLQEKMAEAKAAEVNG